MRTGGAVEDDSANPGLTQERGQHGTNGAESDNSDVIIEFGARGHDCYSPLQTSMNRSS